jgi:hypothetical protein
VRRSLSAASIVAVALLLLAPPPLAGQETPGPRASAEAGTGRIEGRVLDAHSGRALSGAQVVLDGTSRGTLAGINGRFALRDVSVGRAAISISYLGYATKTVTDLEVEEGGSAWIEVTLAPAAVAVAGVTVSAARERGSVTQAVNAQRTALGVVNALGAEQMSRSPDSDAADAIKRVSGVTVQDGKYVSVRGLGERYTTTSLNGARIPSPEPERRVVPLDLFPTGLLETITTSKTFTPDQPGDFSGAQVDIRTREFPGSRQITFSASTTVHPEVTGRPIPVAPGGALDRVALGARDRGIPTEAYRFLSASRGPEVNEVVNAFRNAWSAGEGAAAPAGSFGLSVGGRDELMGRELGYLVSGTYSAGPEMLFDQRRARAGAGDTEFNRYDGHSGRYSVLWGGLANFSTLLGSHTRIALNSSYNRSADNEARIEEGSDEDTNTRLRIQRLQYTERSVRSNQLRVEHQLLPRHRLEWSVTSAAVERDEPDRSEFVTWLDPAVPTWFKHEEGAMRSFGSLDEGSWEGSAAYQWEIGPHPRPHRIKLGGLARHVSRSARSQVFRLQPFHWSETDERWQRAPEEIFDGRYAQGDDDHFLLSRDRTGGRYDARDELAAAFLMGEVALGARTTLIGGARVERSALVLDYESQLGGVGTADPTYTDLLPSLAINIDVTREQKLRFSASQTLARPEYREIAPIAYREVLGGEQVIGNPALRRTLIQNYDVRWEWYPALDEVLSFGLFAKRFTDPIEQRYLARSGTDSRSFENAESAVNHGVEIEALKSLGSLVRALDGITLFANATLMRSVVNTGREDDAKRPMVGQAPYLLNSGVTWTSSHGGTSATLLYNVVGPSIANARPSGSQVADVIEAPQPALDVSVRFPLPGDLSGKLDLKNLLDSPYELRQGDVVREHHRVGRSISVGASWRR